MRPLTLGLAAALLILPVALTGSPPGLPSGPYVLDQARYTEGCFDPCMCPVLVRDDMTGKFDLIPAEVEPGFLSFKVENVEWQVGETDGFTVRGSGTYRISLGMVTKHEMILDLSLDGEPAERFSSGMVTAEKAFAGIDIAVSMNGFYCYDIAFDIRASHRDHPISWGGIKSLFVRN